MLKYRQVCVYIDGLVAIYIYKETDSFKVCIHVGVTSDKRPKLNITRRVNNLTGIPMTGSVRCHSID